MIRWQMLSKRDTENVEAYKEYLKGRYYWTKRTTEGFDKALRCYQKAIDIDPLYALAYAGIASIYNIFHSLTAMIPEIIFPEQKPPRCMLWRSTKLWLRLTRHSAWRSCITIGTGPEPRSRFSMQYRLIQISRVFTNCWVFIFAGGRIGEASSPLKKHRRSILCHR